MTKLVPACAVALTLVAGSSSAQLRADLVVSGLAQPVALVQDPSQPNVQLIVEQGGRVRVLQGGVLLADDFLDLRGQVLFSGERGLLGLAFAPDYATSGRVFLNFVNLSGNTVIARFRRAAGSTIRADPASRFDLVWGDGNAFITQPFTNHKGGNLVFGPDGCLYIGMGDGGSGDDPGHRAQNPLTLLGKILRVDVSVSDSNPRGYVVPANNPFVGNPSVLPEIWAFGVRNPWRFSFDDPSRGGTGALVIADVGEDAWEEVDYEPAGRGGRNYGWRNREGTHDHVTTLPPYYTPLTDPIFEYPHPTGDSITGGYVYRGTALGPPYNGRYFFGDFVSGRIWSLGLDVNPGSGEATAFELLEHTSELGAAAANPSSFGVDAGGELYVLSYVAGTISRIVPGPFVKLTPANGVRGLTSVVNLTWNTLPGASYQVCMTTTGPSCDTVWQSAATPGKLELPGLAAGSYFWQVRAVTGGTTTEADGGTWWTFSFGGAFPYDFTGDKKSDILWHHATRGEVWIWPMNGATRISETPVTTVPDTGYRIAGTGDFNGDGMTDLVWHHATRGEVWVWLMQGTRLVSETLVATVPDTGYRIVATGDFDGDGKTDLVWHHETLGEVWVWPMDGARRITETLAGTAPDVGYQIVGAGDFTGDGRADLVWHHAATGEVWVWLMDGTTPAAQTWVETVPDTGYRIVGVADYTGDGKADLLWHHATRGEVWVWPIDGSTRLTETLVGTVPDTGFHIVGTGDYDGDGKPDILWHHATLGEVWVWPMNGTVKRSENYVATVPDTGYQVFSVR